VAGFRLVVGSLVLLGEVALGLAVGELLEGGGGGVDAGAHGEPVERASSVGF
jgi:hypothetical protein